MSDAVRTKIKEIEDEIARTQKNKATMSHLCRLKARVAQLKRELITPKGGGGGKGEGFDVSKTGDARIGMIGFPSVGKSTLLTRLTGTYSVSAEYEFTTLKTVPGVLKYKGAKLQVLDLPGIIEGANDGKGRGRQVIAVGRSCDVILICLDILKPLGHKRIIEKEVEGMGIRLNGREKRIKFTRTDKGGVQFSYRLKNGQTPTYLSQEIVKSVCAEYKIHCADVRIGEDCTVDDLIDVIEGNRRYIPAIYVLNKIDQITIEELDICYKLPHCVPISAYNMWNFDALLQKIWDYLDLIRIYTKPKGTIPDYSDPVILKKDSTVEGFCTKIHKTLLNQFKYALVWGSSAKHIPQKVGLGHVLKDEDIVQIVKRV